MRDQVAHHLERARIAARLTIIGTIPRSRRDRALRRTMEKIHRDRGIAIAITADPQAKFRGERQDLEEMAGNLVDNAASGRRRKSSSRCWWNGRCAGAGPMLRIIVGRRRPRVVGGRAGAGLRAASGWTSPSQVPAGLSIVVDLAALYGGS